MHHGHHAAGMISIFNNISSHSTPNTMRPNSIHSQRRRGRLFLSFILAIMAGSPSSTRAQYVGDKVIKVAREERGEDVRDTKEPLFFDSPPAGVFSTFAAGRDRGAGGAYPVSSLRNLSLGLDFVGVL